MSAADRRTVGELLADSDAAGPRDAPRRNTRSRAGHGEELESAGRVSGRTVGGRCLRRRTARRDWIRWSGCGRSGRRSAAA